MLGTRIQDSTGKYFTTLEFTITKSIGDAIGGLIYPVERTSDDLAAFIHDLSTDTHSKTVLSFLFPIYCLDEIEGMITNIDKQDRTFSPSFLLSYANAVLVAIETFIAVASGENLKAIATIFYNPTDIAETAISDNAIDSTTQAMLTRIAMRKLKLALYYYFHNAKVYQPTTEQFCDLITTITRSYWHDDQQFADYSTLLQELQLEYTGLSSTVVDNEKAVIMCNRVVEAARIVAILYYNMDAILPGESRTPLDPCLFGDSAPIKLRAFSKAFYYASRNPSFNHVMHTLLIVMRSIITNDAIGLSNFNSVLSVDDGLGDGLLKQAYYHTLPFLFQNSAIYEIFAGSFVDAGDINYIDRAEIAAILINTATVISAYQPKIRDLLSAFIGATANDTFIYMIANVINRENYDTFMVTSEDEAVRATLDIRDIFPEMYTAPDHSQISTACTPSTHGGARRLRRTRRSGDRHRRSRTRKQKHTAARRMHTQLRKHER
jgi:hypothetical protein